MGNREKPDYYALKAKKEGYSARSVYKLEEIDQKFKLINPGLYILDVGASPGSWTQYVLKKIKGKGRICAVDLKELNPLIKSDNLFFLQGDIFEENTQAFIKSHGLYHLLISDAAPSTTGNRTIDAGRSFSLVDQIINLAGLYVCKGGKMVVKIFQGGDEKVLKEHMLTFFNEVKILKPKAVRKESFETYFIGLDRKGVNE